MAVVGSDLYVHARHECCISMIGVAAGHSKLL